MDLQNLREVLEPVANAATVYLDASHDTEDAEHLLQLRWAEARTALEEEGADEATLAALEAAVRDGDHAVGRAGRVLVGRSGEVVLDELLPEPPALPCATWQPVPDLVPLLLDRPEPVPAVVVRVDKLGGEVLTTGPDDGDLGQDPVEVRGSTAPLHKVRGGGWAHLRMQHKVEETWRQNVREVAERIDEELARTAARVLVIAGEEQSRAQLRRELGERAAAGAVDLELTGGRAGPDLDELEKAVAGAVRDVVAADRRAVLERYHQAAGRADGLAVDGLEAVLAALRAEAVDTVLLDGSVQRAAEVWISEVPSQIGTSAAALRELGTEPVARVAADAALLRAAAGTGAALVVVGGGDTGLVAQPIADGVAALLRYPLPSGG